MRNQPSSPEVLAADLAAALNSAWQGWLRCQANNPGPNIDQRCMQAAFFSDTFQQTSPTKDQHQHQNLMQKKPSSEYSRSQWIKLGEVIQQVRSQRPTWVKLWPKARMQNKSTATAAASNGWKIRPNMRINWASQRLRDCQCHF